MRRPATGIRRHGNLRALFFIHAVEKVLLVLTYCIVAVCVADNPVYRPRDVTAPNVADNDRPVVGRQPRRVLSEPVVVLNDRLDTAFSGKVYSDLLKLGSRITQECEVVLHRVLPEMKVERLLSQIS
jgi:hypothetical protein